MVVARSLSTKRLSRYPPKLRWLRTFEAFVRLHMVHPFFPRGAQAWKARVPLGAMVLPGEQGEYDVESAIRRLMNGGNSETIMLEVQRAVHHAFLEFSKIAAKRSKWQRMARNSAANWPGRRSVRDVGARLIDTVKQS
eukprot:1346641-Amphidinium_carterae.1